MASTNRTWLWVVLGIVGTCCLLVVVVIGGAIFEFQQHVKNEVVESTLADQEFAHTRARFAGQQPLIEFVGHDRDDEPTIHRPPADAPRAHINTLRVLVYDLREGHLIHADVPGWLLRMMPNDGRYGGRYRSGEFSADFGEQFQRHQLTIEDIERHGLGLVLDGRNDNSRILIWTE
ncbi:MAG TPA: hypothetical protein VLV86_06700 [Vicinamibacterales bacterium]|nr:hypothetical protein [Vicinamibacterales bacterium]